MEEEFVEEFYRFAIKMTYTFPSHSQGIVQNLSSQEMTTCRQKLEDMEPTERKKRMFQSFGFGQ